MGTRVKKPVFQKTVEKTAIYLDTVRLLDLLLDVAADFPRMYRFVVCDKMIELCIGMTESAAATYSHRDPEEALEDIGEYLSKLAVLRTLVRKAGERGWIKGLARHADIIELTEGLAKQGSAWRASIAAKAEAAGAGES